MLELDVTRLIDDVDPFDISASVAERGKNAGKETWNNAMAETNEKPLLADDTEREAAREWAGEFGAWEAEKIAAWSHAELDALCLQFAAGDLRELQSLCPGDGLGDIDWNEAEQLAQAGTVGGNLYVADDRLYISLS